MDKETHIVLLGAGAVGVLPAVKLRAQKNLRLTVAADNLRALTTYQRAGFGIVRSFSLNGKDGPRQFYVMVRPPREDDFLPENKKKQVK